MGVLITGGNGQLGQALQKLYPNAIATDVSELDITDQASVDSFDWSSVSTIINAAAYTNVDGAETDGYKLAWRVNALGPALLARVARDHDITLVHVSTDYVFDGSQAAWDEDDRFNPLSVYGASKAAGDLAVSATAPKHYIARTSWVIGEGHNFVRTMLKLSEIHSQLTIVNDQIGRPTFTPTLAQAISYLLSANSSFGTYNVTNDGDSVSWADFARSIFALKNVEVEVNGTSTAQYFKEKPQAATRPLQSTLRLDKLKAGGFTPNDWRKDLEIYLSNFVEGENK